jgi:hypothetical protein
MKNYFNLNNSNILLISCCVSILFFPCCKSSTPDWKKQKAIEQKEIAAYYETRKPELLARKIVATLKDEDEKLGIKNITNAGLIRQIQAQSATSVKTKSKLAPLPLTDFFMIYLEKDDELGGYDTEFKEDMTRQLKPTTYRNNYVNAMLASEGSTYVYPEGTDEYIYPKGSYESMFAEFLNKKYLVVIDCISYIAPEISTNDTFTEGLIVKKIRIYNLHNRSLEDDYYLIAVSSDNVDVRVASETAKPSPGRLKSDLWKNYMHLFKYSLFLKERFEGE